MKNISKFKDEPDEISVFLMGLHNNIRNFIKNPDQSSNHVAYFPPIKAETKANGYNEICSLLEKLK